MNEMVSQFSIKYRPRTLDEVFGQEFVVKELKQRAKNNNWPNAILFRGKYGTGKTTIAQIVAMMVNCKNPDENHNPCGKCASCQSIIDETYNRDTLVFDGSILGTKDEIVDFITSNIDFPPMYDNKRVLIIEEADQLSKSAINALHKVLEKPRPHIMFILLSMQSNGVPPSIVSRCQTYNLQDLKPSQIMYAMKNILEKENLWTSEKLTNEFKTHGLALIAQSSNGSLRTAVQLLERAVLGEYFTLKQLEENLNIIDEVQQIELVKSLLNLDLYPIFAKLETMDVYEFINYILAILSSAYVLRETGYSKNDYFNEQNLAIANHPNFPFLLHTFEQLAVQSKPYIRKSEVMILITKYSEQCRNINRSPNGVTLAQNTNVKIRGARV